VSRLVTPEIEKFVANPPNWKGEIEKFQKFNWFSYVAWAYPKIVYRNESETPIAWYDLKTREGYYGEMNVNEG
jgi:hypothetical protein